MARALRVEYPGEVHHVTSRGNEWRNIFRSDADRRMFLEFLALVGLTFLRFSGLVPHAGKYGTATQQVAAPSPLQPVVRRPVVAMRRHHEEDLQRSDLRRSRAS